jgi:hypothetical protein
VTSSLVQIFAHWKTVLNWKIMSLGLTFIQSKSKKSIHISQRTQSMSIIKTTWLMLRKK